MDIVQTIFVVVAVAFWATVLLLILPFRPLRERLGTWAIHHGGVGEGASFLPEDEEPTPGQRLFGLLFFLGFFALFTLFLVYGLFIDT